MDNPLGKIKVYFKNNPKKIISYLKNVKSKKETLDKIRPQIKKMEPNHLFVDKNGDEIDLDLEEETTLEDILDDKDESNLKIIIVDPDSSIQETNQAQTNQNMPQIEEQKSLLKDENTAPVASPNLNEQNKETIENNEGGDSLNKEKSEAQVNQKETEEKPETNNDSQNNCTQEFQSQKGKSENEIEKQFESENSQKNEIHDISPETNNNSQTQNIQENQDEQGKKDARELNDNQRDITNQENLETINKVESQNNEGIENNNQLKKEGIKKNENEANINPEEIINNDERNDEENGAEIITVNNIEEKKENQENNSLNNKIEQNDILEIGQEKEGNKGTNLPKQEEEEGKKLEDVINKDEKNLNTINNDTRNNNQLVNKQEESEAKEKNKKNENKNIYPRNILALKTKTYIFTVIINDKYSNCIKFEFRRNNGQHIGNIIKTTIGNFEELTSSYYFWNTKLMRKLLICEVTFPVDVNHLIILIKNEKNKKDYSWSVITGNSSNLITINLKPFNEVNEKDNIFNDLKTDKEKDSFLINLINYFTDKQVDLKKKFIEVFIKDQIIRPYKKIEDIFSLINIFDNNFLDINFYPIFFEIDKFNYGNTISLTEEIKNKILKLYNDIITYKNIGEIYKEIWIFLIIYLIKMNENEKVLEILSLIEKIKNYENIVKLLFSRIKYLLNLLPESINYFIYILKYVPNELEFMTRYMKDYDKYLDLIIKNIKDLKDNIIYIFPINLRNNINSNNENILHNIIKIIKDKENNLIFDYRIFREKFARNYLNILNMDEKTILINYVKANKSNNDYYAKEIIGELVLDNVNNCNDNKNLLFILTEYEVTYELLEQCSNNLNLDELTDNELDTLKNIMDDELKRYSISKKKKIYFIYFNKMRVLKDFYKIWSIFKIVRFQNENDIESHISKFWVLYKNDKDNDNYSTTRNIFYYLYIFLKNNDEIKAAEFLKSINNLKNIELINNIYELILKKRNKFNDEQKKNIASYYLNNFSEKNYLSLDLKETYSFLSEYFDDQIIEIEDFYKNSKEISGIFNIFNYLNSNNEEFKKTNFYKNSSENFKGFLDSIENNDVNLNQLTVLNDLVKNSDFMQKLEFFNYNEDDKKNFIKNIESKYNLILDKKEKLEICKNYLEFFASSEDSKLKNSIILRIKEVDKPLKKFLKAINETHFSNVFEKLYIRAKKYDKLKAFKVSSIFLNELENKVDKEIEKINYLENKINNMRKILSVLSVKEIDQNYFNEFLSLFLNKDELIDEIKNLKKYFEIEENTSIIEKYIIYKFKNLKLSKTLSSYIEIITQFNLTTTNFFEKIKELQNNNFQLEAIDDNFEENKLEEKIDKIDEYISDFESINNDLNLKIFPMDLISFVINHFQENFLFSFLYDLNINDLRDITNSLSGSSLDINDINDYQLIKSIIDALKEKSGIQNENEENDSKNINQSSLKISTTDIEFLKFIPSVINEKLNGKTLEEFKITLKKCAQNQPKLLVLFENKKGFETSKEDIRSMIKESSFEIYYDKEKIKNNLFTFESRYNCRCIYKDKTEQKFLKELYVLQQLASLSQNKEKVDENKILNIFIDLMENIKEVLSIIDKIVYKGFPEQFHYVIEMKEGIATCKNMNIKTNNSNEISKEKSFLKKLLKKINQFQIEAYKEKKYLKFYYGQQLTMFNDYLKSKVGKSTIKNEVTNLIYYILGNRYIENPQNFIYKSSISAPISFNFNTEMNEILLKTSRNIKESDDIIEEFEITTNQNEDTLSENSKANTLLLPFNESTKKLNKDSRNSLIIHFKQNTFNRLNEGNEKELELLMKDMYNNVEEYLENIMKINNIDNDEEIFINSIIDKDYEDKKGFYISNSGQNIYKCILKFYHCLVGNDPPRFVLLLCNKETSLEEFLSFLYLAIYCPYHSLFIIAKPDRLNLDIIYEVESILEKIYEEEKDIKSYILFLFNDIGKSEIGKELLKICKQADEPNRDLRVIKDTEEISTTPNIENKDFYKNIEIVTSNSAGYGKSYYIQKKCKEENLIYVSFPIGGEIKRQTIMRRLKELHLEKNLNQYGLHLDVSDTKQTELFEDFIFSFLIQKVYTNNENIFCYENNVKIFIEIQNGFLNLMEKFKLFNEFNIHNIDILPKLELQEEEDSFKDKEDMKYDEENNITSFLDIKNKNEKLNHNYLYMSDIQLVCNYLKNLERISEYNIFFYNLIGKSDEYLGYDYYINAEFIKEDECNELLDTYFKKVNKSYHQINIYIKVLADQLRKFSINYYLMIEILKCNGLKGDIRSDIINAFLDLTNFFTIGAFDNIFSEQVLSLNSQKIIYYNEDEEIRKAVNKLSVENPNINFKELNDKGFIFINEDGQSPTIITCAPKDSDIYKRLDELYNSSAKFGNDQGTHLEIPDFTKMEKTEEFLEIIKTIVDSREDIQTIKSKLGTYVFNEDNFFKMVQILLRFRAGIPVLIMGETGCGKTSLINAIAQINNYKMIPFNIHAGITDNEIVHFMIKNNLLENYLGYDEFDDDVDRLNSFNIGEDSSSISISNYSTKNNLKIENEIKEGDKIDNKNKDEKIIIFFDEFNTCNSLGLLTEIMCTNKCQGVKVKKNVLFAGACNPYRKLKPKKAENEDYETTALIKQDSPISKQNLVYTVNPLTYTQLYYVFNFGSLTEDAEKKYITGIVEAEINEYVKDKTKLEEIKAIMIKSFTTAQSFIRDINGKESVSMRETRKFMTIYKFLIEDFERKRLLSISYSKKNEKEKAESKDEDYKFYLNKTKFLGQKYSKAAAIYICFYIRLSTKKNEFEAKMNEILSLEFLQYPNQLQNELISNIKLEKGIAPNESLRLNLFICFIGIITRIAVFLVGPPGCSKTLCFNLLKKEMKGNLSKSKFWKEYPQLIVTSYQGSLTSTSKGIIDTFKDGEKKLMDYINRNNKKDGKVKEKKEKKEKLEKSEIDTEINIKKNFQQSNDKGIIVCVYIDEIGLCELSPSNPLKALHKYLELGYKNQNLDEKLAFVGISNWQLDAAKMNRGIFLNVLNPISSFNQMKETAFQITNIYDKTFTSKYGEMLENLTMVIFNYNLHLKEIKDEQIFFHGTRDFYNLIKTVTKKIIEKFGENKSELKSALFAIECNYNGISRNGINSADYIKKEFKAKYPEAKDIPDFGIVECIKNNLDSDDSRFLLLITKSNLSQYLILRIIRDIREENKIIYYLGSLFEDDLYNEAYSAKSINRIKFYLEHDIVLILKNLSTTYSSLYDLFNQRYTYIKNKKFAEISLGEVSNSSYVNNGLKIIVLIREEKVKEQDPPFLNRFEKYYASFDNILDENAKNIAKKIYNYKKLLFKKKKNKYNFENELINFYEEEIKSLISEYIIKSDNKEQLKEEEIFDVIFEKLSKTFSQELIAYLNHYRKENYPEEIDKINKFYSNTIHSNLETFVKKAAKTINVVYTFTSTVASTKFNFEVENDSFGIINGENIKYLYINLIKTERQLEIEVSDFYESENKLMLINFEESDSSNLEFTLSFLERFEKDKSILEKEKKLIIILIRLKRKKEPYNLDIFVPNLSGIEQTFIDNLNGKDVLICNVMNQNIKELFSNTKLIDVHELFSNELFCCFQKIEYIFQDDTVDQKDYVNNIINIILNDEALINKIIERIINEIEKNYKLKEEKENKNEIILENEENKKNKNIFDDILEKNAFETSIDFVSILSYELKRIFIDYLNKFIINSEKLTILSSLSKPLPRYAIKIWKNFLNTIDFNREINDNLKSNKIKLWTKLNLPSIKSIDFIKNIIESDSEQLIAKYLEEEKEIRDCEFPEEIVQIEDDNEEIEEEDIEEKKKLVKEFFMNDNNDIYDHKFQKAREDIEQFFVPKQQEINYIKKQIEKDSFIKLLENDEEKEELLGLFFKDYFSQIITLLIQREEEFYIDLIIYLISLRFGEKPKTNSLDYYSKSLLWINIYKDEIIFLLKNFGLLKDKFPDILEKVKQKIETNKVSYIISSHHPRHKRLIDKPFLLIIDSFFFNLIEIIENSQGQEVIEMMNIFSEIVQNGELYNSNLSLKSKDFYRFKTLFISIKLFNEKQVYKKEEIDIYISYIKNERKMILENQNDKVAEEIKKQINLLMEKLPECEEKTKTIMKILISKYKEITNINCREILCDLVLSDNNLIKISNEFFIHILDKFSFNPESLDLENNSPDSPFSNSVENNEMYSLYKKIDEKVDCKILSENLKYIFKFKISQYYNEELNKEYKNQEEKIKSEINCYLGDESLMYLRNAHNSLIEMVTSKQENRNNIKKIFCIVYSSFFLERFVYYIVTQKILSSACRTEIINFLKAGGSEIKKTYKLFILKELKTKYILERTEFLNIDKWTEEYQLKDLFENLKFEKQVEKKELQGSLEKLFFGGYTLEDLQTEKEIRSLAKFNQRNLNETQFLCNIDLFINDNLSTLKTEEGKELCKNSIDMKDFNNYVTNSLHYSNSTKNLINLFFKEEEFNIKLSDIVNNTNYFEILLYAYKFAIICSMADQNSVFSKMINEKMVENIKNSYIPGVDLFCDSLVESYLNMKKPISQSHNGGYANGYYICDCGEYYFQPPCGVPTTLYYCANCSKKIGGLNQKLIIRDEDNGVYKIMRIYPDEKNKNDVQARGDLQSIYGQNFENGYPNKIFKDFEKEMKQKMNEDYRGIHEQCYLLFINETKNIRKISNQVTYRLLNFIIYSNIYYGLKCGFLSIDDINKNNYIPIEEKPYEGSYTEDEDDSYNDYRAKLLNKRKEGISDEKSIIEILRLNWILLEKQLKEKNVNSIQIYINTIIKGLFEFIKTSNDMSTPEQRNSFESEFDSFINQSILDYENNSANYIENIDKIMSNNLEIEYKILERENMMNNVEIKYPYYYEFLSIPLVKEDDIKDRLKLIENVEKIYPVLFSYLNSDKKNVEYLQTFSQINNFVNYTIEHYSNAISREDAGKTIIRNEIGNNIPLRLFNEFLDSFNKKKLYKIANQYECHSFKFDLRELSRDDFLSNFLIDNGVQGYGMQLAGLYQKYISFQNQFLDDVIYIIGENNNEIIGNSERLEYLKTKIKQEINPQKANKYNLLNFDITTENYSSFLEMVLFYSYKDSQSPIPNPQSPIPNPNPHYFNLE